jgi:CheY-like chemotaxis protein
MAARSDDESGFKGAWRPVRYVLIDRTGPRAEFDNWHDAFEYMAASGVQGESIVRSEEPTADQCSPSASGAATNSQAPRTSDHQSPKKVLVIEDEMFTLLSMTQMVKSAGHQVTIARDADEGVAAIRSERPDLILIDVTLSASGQGWDGFQVIDWMNRHFPRHGTKYIIVSGGDPKKLGARSAAVGASAFLGKPIVKNLLLSEVERALGVSQ